MRPCAYSIGATFCRPINTLHLCEVELCYESPKILSEQAMIFTPSAIVQTLGLGVVICVRNPIAIQGAIRWLLSIKYAFTMSKGNIKLIPVSIASLAAKNLSVWQSEKVHEGPLCVVSQHIKKHHTRGVCMCLHDHKYQS